MPFALSRGLLDGPNDCTIKVRVQSRASRDRVQGFREGALRVSVTAPPHDGKANAALLELLAASLGIAKSRLRIVRGHAGRDKVVAVERMTEKEVAHLLNGQQGAAFNITASSREGFRGGLKDG